MIVVFESTVSVRAQMLRDYLLTKGFPCAVCTPENIKDLMPVGIIVTFTDQLDIVRRMPYDDIPVVVYGDGFVNSALNAIKAPTRRDLVRKLGKIVGQKLGITKKNSIRGIGAFFYPGVFLSAFQLIVYGTRIELTENESNIIRCLILSGNSYRSPKQLAAYCIRREVCENCIRVHICAINKKGEARLPRPLIVSKHGSGYRFGYSAEQ